jgi:hypothetical protein
MGLARRLATSEGAYVAAIYSVSNFALIGVLFMGAGASLCARGMLLLLCKVGVGGRGTTADRVVLRCVCVCVNVYRTKPRQTH